MELPIDAFIAQIKQSLLENPSLVLQASPGSGKTTRVCPALLDSPFNQGKSIFVLEPRRLAAKYAAIRIAEERDLKVGQEVGYQFRFEKVASPRTRLLFVTEAMLMRFLIHDRNLSKAGTIILDEFHERHLHADIALAYCKRLQSTTRPDLRVVIMSATLDTERLCEYLNACPTIHVQSPRFPVDIDYISSARAKPLEQILSSQLKDQQKRPIKGNTLVFLPGMAEIRKCQQALHWLSSKGTEVLPLHGDLDRQEQEKAFDPNIKSKIILSTNIAESSLTLPDISWVIDSGLHRQALYSPWSGIPELRTVPISRASADQRAGRAGRTQEGNCTRLYTHSDYKTRPAYDKAEILRADLTQTVLELKGLGVSDLQAFPWFQFPEEKSLEACEKMLIQLGALDKSRNITDMGKKMWQLPLAPRLARTLFESEKLGVAFSVAKIISILVEGRSATHPTEDLFSIPLNGRMQRTHRQILAALGKNNESDSVQDHTRITKSFLTGFPDRIAKKRGKNSKRTRAGFRELVFASGGSGWVSERLTSEKDDYFIVLEAKKTSQPNRPQSTIHANWVLPIEENWLFDLSPCLIEESEEIYWDEKLQKVHAVSKLNHLGLPLVEEPSAATPSAATAKLLFKHILKLNKTDQEHLEGWIRALGYFVDKRKLETLFAQLLLLSKHPQLALKIDETKITSYCKESIEKMTSLQEVKTHDWLWELKSVVPASMHHHWDRWFPSHITLPKGRRVPVRYEINQAPYIASRLQDFFGLAKTPTLLEGNLNLTVHLLAPNGRAVQVTTDLENFWRSTYQQVRGELRGRYPKHAWPEKP